MKVYAEVGNKKQIWDRSQKETVTFRDYSDPNVMKFMKWRIEAHTLTKLCVAEYVLVSLSLALVIAKFFPAYHSKIVSKAATLEYKSLYWGTVVVSNLCIYGLLFVTGRALSVFLNVNTWSEALTSIIIPCIQEIVIHIIFLVAALFVSIKSNPGTDIPIPTGMAKLIINISFCFTCFCCCFCCSSRCRSKTLRVLVLFSFMGFIYRSIMDTISVGFFLFIDVSGTFTITLLYISLLLFLVALASYSLLITIPDRNTTFHRQSLNCCAGAVMVLTVFGGVMLIVIVYMIIVFSLKLSGIKGVVTGLIPSIVLSAASWYIKKRLHRDESKPNNSAAYGAAAGSVNDERSRDARESSDDDTAEQRRLLP